MARMALKNYLRDNWPQLALVALTNVSSVYVTMQVTAAQSRMELEAVKARVAKIESLEPEKTKWQGDAQQRTIDAMQAQQTATQATINSVNVNLSALNTKVDTLVDAMKAHAH